jgi:hypothetical protein
VAVGSATTCKATVRGSGLLPTGVVAWSSNGTGKFSKLTCKLSDGACSVKFTPTAVGSIVTLTASYWGDFESAPSADAYSLAVMLKATKTTVSCTPKSAVAGSSTVITCKAKVTGYSPMGTVNWSQSGTGSVLLGLTSCTLSRGTCSARVTASTSGHVTITATYSGDQNNRASSRTAKLTVKKASTVVAMSCAQSSIGKGAKVVCTVTVLGKYSSHNGTVTWSKTSGKGGVSFSSATCTLSSGSCSVTVTATHAGTIKIKADYGGDSNNLKSSGTLVLTIA